jgi:hypothetical protein
MQADEFLVKPKTGKTRRDVNGLFGMFSDGKLSSKDFIRQKAEETSKENKTAFGCFSEFADPSKIAGEKGVWANAAVEKHRKEAK